MDITCPACGESEELRGRRSETSIAMTCESCGHEWNRSLKPSCPECGSTDMQTVPLAIVEKSRGTQLSVLGTRPIDLCSVCDAEKLARRKTSAGTSGSSSAKRMRVGNVMCSNTAKLLLVR